MGEMSGAALSEVGIGGSMSAVIMQRPSEERTHLIFNAAAPVVGTISSQQIDLFRLRRNHFQKLVKCLVR